MVKKYIICDGNFMLAKIKKIIFNRYFLMSAVVLVAIISAWYFTRTHSLFGTISNDDQFYYDDIAMNILDGRGIFATWDLWIYACMRVPFYPLLLSLIYLFFGHSFLAAEIFQFILGIFTCLFVYLIVERIFNKIIAFFTAIIVGIYPIYLAFNLQLMRESSFIFLFVVFSYLILKTLDNPVWKNFILSGLLFGLMVLNRPTIFFALPLILSWLLIIFRKNRKLFFPLSIGLGLIPALMIGGWLIRGQIVAGAPSMEYPGTLNMWAYATNHSKEYERDNMTVNPEILWDKPYASEGERVKRLTNESLQGIFRNPVGLIKKGTHNLFTMHCFSGTCSTLWEPFLMILGFIGLSFGLILLPITTIYFLICILAVVVPSAIFGGSGTSRFRNPLDWIYIMYALFFIYVLGKSLINRRSLMNLISNKEFGQIKQNENNILKHARRLIILIVVATIVFGLLKIGYNNVFCKNTYLSGISNQEAEEILAKNKFLINRSLKNWESFENIKNYIFGHQMNLDDYRGTLINWTGIIRNPAYIGANQKMNNMIVLRADNIHSFESTFFNFIITSNTCSLGGGNFYAIFPGRLPENFKDKYVAVLGQLKQNNTPADRFGIHVIAIVLIDKQGQLDFNQLVFAENITQLQKQSDFYKNK